MTSKIENSLNNTYNNTIYKIDSKTAAKPSPPNQPELGTQKQLTEIPNTINSSGIKVPMSYKKTGEKTLPYGLKAHFYKLANGQRVVILPKEGRTVLRSYVNTGSLNEPDNIRGISHYIEHNLFNGSEGLDAGEFFATTDKMGAYTNASTGMAETDYFISSHLLNEGDLEKEIKIHASMLETPKFAVDMLEKEKGIVNSEINMVNGDAENLAFNNTLKLLFNIKTTSNDVIAGTTNNITNLTREDVVNYFNNNYYPANMVTVISGEVEPEETMNLLAKHFTSTKTPPASRYYEDLSPISKSTRQDIISDKTETPIMVLGFTGPNNNNTKDAIYTEALSKLMFSSSNADKVFNEINASVGAVSEKVLAKSNVPSALMVVGDSSEENSELMLRKVYSQIQKYQNTPVSQEDLTILKRDMKKEFEEMFESSFTINHFIGTSSLVNNVDDINKYEKMIDEMTPQDLQNAARKYFDLNKAAITMLHPNNTDANKLSQNYIKSSNISFSGQIKKEAFNINNVKQYKLPNNYKVSTYDSNFPYVHANFSLKAGKPVIAKNPAAYAVLNEILENGTMKKDTETFLRKIEKDGTDLDVNINRFGITAYFSADAKDFDTAFENFNELLTTPRFTQETFEKAVRDVQDRLSRSEKNPYNKLAPELDKNSHTNEEIIASLNTIKLEDVKQLYSDLTQNAQGLSSIAAPFKNNPELKNKVLGAIARLNPVEEFNPVLRNDYIPVNETKVLTETDNKPQAKILMAYKFKRNGNIKDEASLKLMNIILGDGPTSMLFDDLREKQHLAYSVRSALTKKLDTGVMTLSIGTTTDNKMTGEQSFANLQKSIEGFKDNINKITKEKVTQEDLNKAKLALKDTILAENEETFRKNTSLLAGSASWYGANYYNQLLDTIDSITVDDIYNTANYVFKGKPVFSIVASKDTLDYNQEYFTNLKTHN